jgi:hypothetical protein
VTNSRQTHAGDVLKHAVGAWALAARLEQLPLADAVDALLLLEPALAALALQADRALGAGTHGRGGTSVRKLAQASRGFGRRSTRAC